MPIVITDEEIKSTGMSETELKVELAVRLYQLQVLSMGRAAKLAGIPYVQMMSELTQRKIPMNYDVPDFLKDVETLRNLRK
jgi:predicted HTH domain antitoxin